MKDAIRRTIRTFVQAFIGVILAQAAGLAVQASSGDLVVDQDWMTRVGISALFSATIAALTFVQNLLEDNTKMPALGKTADSGAQNPKPIIPDA